MRPRNGWLCLPPLLFACVDYTLTLLGQSPLYWAGRYELAEEANPVAWVFLAWHPSAFLVLAALWIAVFCAAILAMPPFSARLVCLAVTFGHALGSATWLWRLGLGGVILAGVLLLLAERLVDLAWKRHARLAGVS